MDTGYNTYQQKRISFWDKVWNKRQNRKGLGAAYHRRLLEVYKFVLPANSTILEIGSGNGKLLGYLPGTQKLGIDFSQNAVDLARHNFTDCEFICSDLMQFQADQKFDYIILSDLVVDLWDIELALRKLKDCCHPETRIIRFPR